MNTLKVVPVCELHLYRGRTADDVLSGDGALLLPKGSSVPTILTAIPGIQDILLSWNIESLPLLIDYEVSEREFEAIVRAVEPKTALLDPALAGRAIHQVEEVYQRINENNSSREGIETLSREAKKLTAEVLRSPQILLCLGRVKDADEYTYVHSLNVALLSGYLANILHPGDRDLMEAMTFGGLLHDLGKARVSQEILNKPGKLTPDEFEMMKAHSIQGMIIAVSSKVGDRRILSIIRNHHERWSGDGYPDGLRENRISLHARIAAVADVFDALTAKRVYKDPIKSREAVTMIIESSGKSFDPAIVRALLVSVGLFPPGTMVELSDGSIGVVTGARSTDIYLPQVLLTTDSMGRRVEGNTIIDLALQRGLFIRRALDDIGKGVRYELAKA